MTVVALGVVFADNGGCPCNPQPPVSKIKEIENTRGNIQPLGECMRTWIEYRCTPKEYTNWKVIRCVNIAEWPTYEFYVKCERTWSQLCDKYRVWYDNCTHQVMYEEYLGEVIRSGKETSAHTDIKCTCP